MATGRAVVRQAVQAWFDPSAGSLWSLADPGPPDALDKVWTSFPAEIDFQQWMRVQQGIPTRAQAVVFIGGQSETRETMGGWKYVTVSTVLQVFCQSYQQNPDDAMADVDTLHDAIHDRAAATNAAGEHTFGQDPTVIFKAAEPGIRSTFGEPYQDESAATQIWFQLAFDLNTFYLA